MSGVFIEVVEECMECGYKRSYLMEHPQADAKSDINEYDDEETQGWTSHPHPCKDGLGGRMKRKVRAHQPPPGRVAVGGEERCEPGHV